MRRPRQPSAHRRGRGRPREGHRRGPRLRRSPEGDRPARQRPAPPGSPGPRHGAAATSSDASIGAVSPGHRAGGIHPRLRATRRRLAHRPRSSMAGGAASPRPRWSGTTTAPVCRAGTRMHEAGTDRPPGAAGRRRRGKRRGPRGAPARVRAPLRPADGARAMDGADIRAIGTAVILFARVSFSPACPTSRAAAGSQRP